MKKKINLSKLMNQAWTLAREGAKRFGGNAKMYFVSALAIVWKEEKARVNEKTVSIYYKGIGNRFLLPGMPLPVFKAKKGQCNLPGIRP